MIAYVALGALAGSFGYGLDRTAGYLTGVNWISGFLVGVLLLLSGFSIAFPNWSASALWSRMLNYLPSFEPKRIEFTHIAKRAPGRSGLLLGLGASFLPCGWLYSFVVMAAGSASVLGGGIIMLAFWLGTVPALLLGTTIARRILSMFGSYSKLIAGGVVVGAGTISLVLHFSNAGHVLHSCH
jgi:uncharacterized protein